MATAPFVIRCKCASGSFTMRSMTPDTTVKSFKEVVAECTSMKLENLKFLVGFPPRVIKISDDNQRLKDVGIKHGETIIVQYDDSLDAQVVPEMSEIPKKKVNLLFRSPALDNSIMMRHEVPSDNSCLFSSIFFIVHGGYLDVTEAIQMRKIISDVVSSDPSKYNGAILGRENGEYCKWIMNPDSWGGAIELAILSEFYKMEIVAIDIINLQSHRFGENEDYKIRCFVVYDGIHYDPLYMAYDEQNQTIFGINEMNLMDMALSIAKEARASKQYTDTANFSLKCCECGQRLTGEKDATAHASATGHVRFGEIS